MITALQILNKTLIILWTNSMPSKNDNNTEKTMLKTFYSDRRKMFTQGGKINDIARARLRSTFFIINSLTEDSKQSEVLKGARDF